MPPAEFLFLSQEDVAAAGGLDMDACLETIAETLDLHQRGQTIAPQKSALPWGDGLADERVLVSPVGMGIEDVAWATRVYRRAEELGIGARQRLWQEPIWT